MKLIKTFEAYKSLQEFGDKNAEGTLGKNRAIYTNMYDYYMSTHNKNKRQHVVGWLADDSQIRNFKHILPHVEEGDYILDYGCGVGDLVPFLLSNYKDFNYVGVDINEKFIDDAKRTYSGYDFRKIDSPLEIDAEFDVIVALGVFTWYITKQDFIDTIRHLYSKCKRKLVFTCISSRYALHSWTAEYRGYNPEIISSLFPDLQENIKFENKDRDLVVILEK